MLTSWDNMSDYGMIYLLTHFPPPFSRSDYAHKFYDMTLPVRESSMVVWGVVCVQNKNARHK